MVGVLRRALWAGVLLLTTLADGGPVAMAQIELLEAQRWRHRLLLILVPSATLDAPRRLAATLAERQCELVERDLLIGWLWGAEAGRLDQEPLGEAARLELRARLGIGREEFAVVLIGKDGGVKARYDSVPSLDDVFALIDRMPMRRAEMRGQVSCE